MKIDWFTFAAQVVNFLVLVYLLKRFLYAPITAAMKTREDLIAQRFASANQTQQDAERRIEDYRRRTEQWEHERHRLFEESKQEVEASRQELLKQARADVERRREDWLAALRRERETLAQLVKQRCSEQVTSATRAALRHLADADLEEQMLRAFAGKLVEQGVHRRATIAKDREMQATVVSAFEISSIWRTRLQDALQQHYAMESIEFRVSPDVVCGLEVRFGSQKIGWSVAEYLTTLDDQLTQLVQQPTP